MQYVVANFQAIPHYILILLGLDIEKNYDWA
jgi:hypothetical protein